MCVDKAKERENQADAKTHRNSPLKQHDTKIEESKKKFKNGKRHMLILIDDD